MKINWGVGIVIAIGCFMSFIIFLGVKMSTDKKFDHDLVTKEYYKQELAYQGELDALQNASGLSENVEVDVTNLAIEIKFPAGKTISTGSVNLYRPSNEKLDLEFPVELDKQRMSIPVDQLVEGKYKLSVNWESGNTKYLYREDLQIKN